MWTHPGFRSRESQWLCCFLSGLLVGSVVCCPATPRNRFSCGTWNSSHLPAAVIWMSNILLSVNLGSCSCFIACSISVIQQDACSACISHVIEFARHIGVLGMYHNPQCKLWLLYWGVCVGFLLLVLVWVFFRKIFSVLSHCVSV